MRSRWSLNKSWSVRWQFKTGKVETHQQSLNFSALERWCHICDSPASVCPIVRIVNSKMKEDLSGVMNIFSAFAHRKPK